MIQACAEAVEELRALRKAYESQGILVERQSEMLKLEQEISGLKDRTNELSAKEIEQLKIALAMKDKVIAASEAEVAVLKKKQMTFWKKAKWFVIGGAAGVAICAVACK